MRFHLSTLLRYGMQGSLFAILCIFSLSMFLVPSAQAKGKEVTSKSKTVAKKFSPKVAKKDKGKQVKDNKNKAKGSAPQQPAIRDQQQVKREQEAEAARQNEINKIREMMKEVENAAK